MVRPHIILFFLESAGLAICLHDRVPTLPLSLIPGSIILAGLILFMIIYTEARLLARRTRADHHTFFAPLLVSLSPLLLLLFFLLTHFFFLRDFRPALLVLVFSGIALLQILFLSHLRRNYPGFCRIRWERWSERPHLLFFWAAVVYALLASGLVLPSQPLTGDEPHYLLLTKSLLEDGDIDLANNYQNKDYLDFYGAPLDTHTRPGKRGGQYARHAPGLPLLLCPAYFVGDRGGKLVSRLTRNPRLQGRALVFSVRLAMGLLAAGLGLIFFRLMVTLFGDGKISLLAWLAFSFTPPLLFYSQLIYPEIGAALIGLIVFAWLIRDQKAQGSVLSLFLLAVGVSLLPWLGIKYAALTVSAWIALAISVKKAQGFRLTNFTALVFPPLLSALLFFFYLWHLYGSLSPKAMYRGTFAYKPLQVSPFFHLRLSETIRCGLGYLFDQRAGLLFYSPLYLMALAGAIFLFKRNRKAFLYLLVFFLPFWIFCSLAYYWGGFCPPGRTLLPVLWVGALFVGAAMAEAKSVVSSFIVRSLLFLSILIGIVGTLWPRLLYHENLSFFLSEEGRASNLLTSLSNSFIDLTRFAPHLINQEPVFKAPLLCWLGFTLLLTLVLLKKPQPTLATGPSLLPPRFLLSSGLFGILSLLVLTYIFFDINLCTPHPLGEGKLSLYFQDDKAFAPENDGFWTKGRTVTTVILESAQPAPGLSLTLTSPVSARATMSVGKDKKAVAMRPNHGSGQTVVFPQPVGFPWRGKYFYTLRIRSDTGFYPSRLDRSSTDGRFLGVFVRAKISGQPGGSNEVKGKI